MTRLLNPAALQREARSPWGNSSHAARIDLGGMVEYNEGSRPLFTRAATGWERVLPKVSQLHTLLGAVRRRRRALSLGSGVVALAGVLLAVTAAAVAAGDRIAVPGPTRAVFLSISFAAVAVAVLRLLRRLVSYPGDDALALQVERRYPGLKSKLISSVQLRRAREGGATQDLFSDALIEALVERTEHEAALVRPGQVVAAEGLIRRGALLAVCALALLFTAAMAPGRFASSLSGLFRPQIPKRPAVTRDGKAPLVIGDITLRYTYPAYAGLAPKTVQNTNGSIRALPGSEVHISATTAVDVESANLFLNGSERIPMAVSGDGRIEGRLSVTGEGYYQFEVSPVGGKRLLDAAKREIALEPDGPPTVELIWPSENIVATERQVIELTYTAEDDFGLSDVTLVVRIGKEEKRIPLHSFSSAHKSLESTYKWRLGELALDEVQELAYCVEAKDNDNVSGPKVGRSAMRHILIENARTRHEALILRQQELLKKMLRLLAVDLTSPLDDSETEWTKDDVMLVENMVREHLKSTLNLFSEILAKMKDDSLANYAVYYALEDMRDGLNEIAQRRSRARFMLSRLPGAEVLPKGRLSLLADVQREQIPIVEKDVLVLSGLIGKQRLDNVQEDIKRLAAARERLAELLARLEKGPDPEAMAELRKLMAEIERLMRKIQGETRKLAKDVPIGAFLNPQTMAAPQDLMQQIREALARGDREEAMRLAREMMQALDSYSAAFGNADRMFSSAAYSGMLGQMGDLMRKLDELAQAETGLLSESKKLKKAIRKRTHGDMDDKLREFFEKQLKRLERVNAKVDEADTALSGDRGVKEYFQKDEERREAINRKRSLLGYFGIARRAIEGKKLKEKLDALSKQVAEAQEYLDRRKGARDLAAVMRDIPDLRDQLRQLKEMLAIWDVQESTELAEDVGRDLDRWARILSRSQSATPRPACGETVEKKLDEAAEEMAQMLKDLEQMRQWVENYQRQRFRSNEQEAMQELAKRQQAIREKTNELGHKMDAFQKRSPFVKEDAAQDVNKASNHMGSARDKLEGQSPGSAVTEEREAVYQLEQAKRRLDKAKERIAKGMMGGGMSMPGGGRENRGREGVLGVRLERIKLPSPEEYKVPKEYRQEILDAMKGPTPKEYRKLNEDYYKRLLDR